MRLVTVYGSIFVLFISFLIYSSQHQGVATVQQQDLASASRESSPAAAEETISVDKLTAASAVTSLAETTNLPSAGDLRETTTSLSIKKDLAQSDTEAIVKPEIIKPETSAQRGITSYVTKQGDSMESIARQFNISTQTLRWANNTTSDAVEPGKTITIPRVDGVVYVVKEGDTVQSLAEKYKSNSERIILYNDIDEGASLTVGAKIVLPNGELPEAERPGYTAPRTSTYTYSGSGVSYGGNVTASVGNRYAAGNCTWYAYERRAALGRPIGSFWGNANTWAMSARAAGFTVNSTPAPGAIFQTTSGYYGHVGIVDRVENGVVYVSDMNYAGYGVVTHRTLDNPSGYLYIH